MSEVRIRAATVNLFAHHGDWDRRRPARRQALRDLDADVLALQEAVVDGGGDMARALLGDGTHRGSSVASRWPVRAVHEVDLHLTDRTHDYSCGTVIAEIDSPAGRLLISSHGSSWPCWAERERELQAVAVASAVEELVAAEPAHVVRAATSTPSRTSGMRFLTGRTFDPRNPAATTTPHCGSPTRLAVHEPVDGVQPSDHYGVVGDLVPWSP